MKFVSTALAFLPLWAAANQFIDDYGRAHVLRSEPRVFCSANIAISLLHLGMPEEWLIATWGMPYNRASNLRKGQDSEYFAMDAQPEDLAILEKKISVSHPHCFDTDHPDDECLSLPDDDKIKELAGKVTLIIDVSGWGDFSLLNASAILEVPVVSIDSSFDGARNCIDAAEVYLGAVDKNCYKRSYLDVTNRLYELAEWMGIDTRHDRDLLCKSTQRFQEAAKAVHDKGIRFATASIQENSTFFGVDGAVVFLTNPLHYAMARTMEEIGLPMLWPGLCQEDICKQMGELPAAYEVIPADLYFKSCPNGQIEPGCATDTMYKVDFWLLEGYGLEMYEDDPKAFTANFPDPALLAGQFMAFPYDKHEYSHKALAGWLDAFTERMKTAERIHEPTPCSDAHVTSLGYINYEDLELGGGEYACWNPQYYNSEYSTCPPKEFEDSGLADGAVAGIAVGAAVVGAVLMFMVMKFALGYRTGIDKNFKESNSANDGEYEGKENESNTSQAPSQVGDVHL